MTYKGNWTEINGALIYRWNLRVVFPLSLSLSLSVSADWNFQVGRRRRARCTRPNAVRTTCAASWWLWTRCSSHWDVSAEAWCRPSSSPAIRWAASSRCRRSAAAASRPTSGPTASDACPRRCTISTSSTIRVAGRSPLVEHRIKLLTSCTRSPSPAIFSRFSPSRSFIYLWFSEFAVSALARSSRLMAGLCRHITHLSFMVVLVESFILMFAHFYNLFIIFLIFLIFMIVCCVSVVVVVAVNSCCRPMNKDWLAWASRCTLPKHRRPIRAVCWSRWTSCSLPADKRWRPSSAEFSAITITDGGNVFSKFLYFIIFFIFIFWFVAHPLPMFHSSHRYFIIRYLLVLSVAEHEISIGRGPDLYDEWRPSSVWWKSFIDKRQQEFLSMDDAYHSVEWWGYSSSPITRGGKNVLDQSNVRAGLTRIDVVGVVDRSTWIDIKEHRPALDGDE